MTSLEGSHHFFESWDGTELYYREFQPEKKKGVLIVIHGLAEHSGRYRFLWDYFRRKGWAIYLMDQRGHGRSPGSRCHADHFQDLVEDLDSFVRMVAAKEKKLPIFLIAHSFGGQVAVNYLARHPKELKGVVLSGPNLKLAMPISPLKRYLGVAAARFRPRVSVANEIDPTWVSRDAAVVAAYSEDPLVGNKISLRLGAEILDNLERVMALAPKLSLPSLLLHGEGDKITSIEGTREFFSKIHFKDKTLKIYPGYHENFNETNRQEIFEEIESWLNARLK
jgi:acylglycerol lipase